MLAKSKRKRRKDFGGERAQESHAKVAICVRITFLCNASLWHCDFLVMREHARANGSIFLPAHSLLSLLSFLKFSYSLGPSFLLSLFRHAISIIFYALFHYIIFIFMTFNFTVEKVNLSSYNSVAWEHNLIFFLFLTLRGSHTRLLSLPVFVCLSRSLSPPLGAVVSFVPSAPFMQILMATTADSYESYS